MSSYKLSEFALHFLFVLATCIYASEATFFPPPCPSPPAPPQNQTSIFYLHVVLANGTNSAIANTIPVAGIQGKSFGLQQVGTIFVFEVNVTSGPSQSSTVIGQNYGTIDVVGLSGFIYQISSVIEFTSGNLSGSSLVLHGIFNMSQQVSYIAIVGGTNVSTYATGFAIYEIVAMQPDIAVKVTTNYKITA